MIRRLAAALPPSAFIDFGRYLESVYSQSKSELSRYSYKDFSKDLGLGAGNSAWLIMGAKGIQIR
jgi:hypothetical protein